MKNYRRNAAHKKLKINSIYQIVIRPAYLQDQISCHNRGYNMVVPRAVEGKKIRLECLRHHWSICTLCPDIFHPFEVGIYASNANFKWMKTIKNIY